MATPVRKDAVGRGHKQNTTLPPRAPMHPCCVTLCTLPDALSFARQAIPLTHAAACAQPCQVKQGKGGQHGSPYSIPLECQDRCASPPSADAQRQSNASRMSMSLGIGTQRSVPYYATQSNRRHFRQAHQRKKLDGPAFRTRQPLLRANGT